MKGQFDGNDNTKWFFNRITVGRGEMEFNGHTILNPIDANFYPANGAGGRKRHAVIVKGNRDIRNRENADKKRDDLFKKPTWSDHDDYTTPFLALPRLGAENRITLV